MVPDTFSSTNLYELLSRAPCIYGTWGGIQAADALIQQYGGADQTKVAQLKAGFSQIDDAINANPVNDTELWDSVSSLAFYEQTQVLQPILAPYSQPNSNFWTSFSAAHGDLIDSLIPNTQNFAQVEPNGDFGNPTDRLTFFSSNLLPAFELFIDQNPNYSIDVAQLLKQ